ncbi:MAG: FAD-dependent oxidoreductase [Alphaproteobacteria bacterium]|nr:FAD-dependent oxidoreductase [Alphaproteobacteria bacterium]
MTGYDHVSAPGQIGNLTIRNRVSMSPMERNWADRLGNPTQAYIDYLVERAKGGVGLMGVESTYIDARGRGNMFQLGLWHDSNIDWHKKLNDAVKPHGVRTQAEINHGGRNCSIPRTGLQPVAPSQIPNDIVGANVLKELKADGISEIVERFADGARRAIAAGYDMITIHGAHGYLITSFLSPKYNQRDDDYGGSEENRWRFPRRVFEAIRQEVGGDVPVGIRISAIEDVEGGMTIEQSANFINHLSELGLDYVDVSAGIYESLETVIQPMDLQQGCLLPHARAIREKVSIPVIAAGRINDIDIAERAVSSGDADFVHMGRAFHADPEIYAKTVNGNKDKVIGCIACNQCCAVLFVNERSVCTVNPAAGRERSMPIIAAQTPKKVMVVGGGLAGMEAAAVAAQRGHDVTLYEKNDTCGGIITIMRSARNRLNWGRAAEDRIQLLRESGAKVVTGKEITPDDIRAEKPDVLILATGTKPFMPAYIPGIDEDIVTNYDDLIRGRTDVGVNVVLLGGNMSIATTTAEYLAENGADVTVIEATETLAEDEEYMARKVLMERIEANSQITVRTNANIEEIREDSVIVQSGGETEELEDIDQVVVALLRDMDRDLIENVTGGLTDELGIETHVIGDASWPRHPYYAVLEGSNIGRAI